MTLLCCWDTPEHTIMIIGQRAIGDFTVLSLDGALKTGEGSRTLDRVLSQGQGHVMIDFSKVNYMDSAGISQLVGHLNRFTAEERKLILVNPSDRIRRLLEMVRLLDVIPVYSTVEEALTAEE